MTWINKLNSDQRRLIFGNEQGTDPATAYVKKRAVHAGVKGLSVAPEQTQSTWIRETATAQGTLEDACVYINIPFCQTKCTYCGFYKNHAEPATIADYTAALLEELAMAESSALIEQTRVRAVYIGGGTPGTLNPRQIQQLLERIRRHLPLANDCEITFETRTHELGPEKLQACIDYGVNRFSLGVQSFDTRARRAIGRIDSGQGVIENIRRMQDFHQAPVSIDLIFGLPHQSIDTYLEDILTADRLGIDGMALYQLNVFEGGRMDQSIKAGQTIPVADTATQYRYHQAAHRLLSDMGYHQLSMSHWVQGTLDRSVYNRFSKQGSIIHAFGAGAGGRTGQYRYFVHPSVNNYLDQISKGIKPIMGMTATVPMARLYDFITGQLDTGRLRFDLAKELFDIDLKTLCAPLLDSWEQRGLVAVGERMLQLLPAGQFWYVTMNQALLDVLEIITSNGAYEPRQERIAAQG